MPLTAPSSAPLSASSECTICLVRHGETPWNAERRLQGHLDIELNTNGLAQAQRTAHSLAGQRFAAIYSSDLQRARQTADAIAGRCAQPVHAEPRLRERHYGAFQGLTYEEAETRFPEAFARFKAREPEFPFPGEGESLIGFAARIHAALGAIAARHAGTQVLVVTHGGVLDIAHRLATGKALTATRDFAIANAALNWIAHRDGEWRLIAWADERHLQSALDELPNT